MLISLFFAFLLPLSLAPSLASAGEEPLRFRFLPEESQILTQIPNPFGIVNGEFTLREGKAKGDVQDLQGTGRVRLTIDAASYHSNIRLRDQDVQENYLEADQYPAITFTSKGVENVKHSNSPNETWEFTIKGNLELHGTTRELRIPVRLTQRGKRITVEGSTAILFKDFNIAVPTLLFIQSGDHANVSFRFVGERQP